MRCRVHEDAEGALGEDHRREEGARGGQVEGAGPRGGRDAAARPRAPRARADQVLLTTDSTYAYSRSTDGLVLLEGHVV